LQCDLSVSALDAESERNCCNSALLVGRLRRRGWSTAKRLWWRGVPRVVALKRLWWRGVPRVVALDLGAMAVFQPVSWIYS
jgi:hypothetical protein